MSNLGTNETTRDSAKAAPEQKKRYEKPALVEYGDVREFTRGAGGSLPDELFGDSFSKG